MEFDAKEIFVRLLKYFVEGLVVAIAAWYIPGRKVDVTDILTIGIIAAATFSIIDLFAPSLSNSLRNGVGLSLGTGLTGGILTR